MPPLQLTTVQVAKMAAKEDSECATKRPVPGQADATQTTKNKMVAEASPDYAFVAVSPSMVPEEKSQPKRALICILGTLLGGMLSVFIVLVTHYVRGSDKK